MNKKTFLTKAVAWARVVTACAALLAALAGCGRLSLIPVTLKEVKDFAFGQDQSFSYPLSEVLAAMAESLANAGFQLERIEYFNEAGHIEARWRQTDVAIELESITPRATKAMGRISSDSISREYSLEETIFENVENALKADRVPDLKTLVEGMSKVHMAPEANSPVVAYLGQGATVKVVSQDSHWLEISLQNGYSGYIRESRVQ